MRLKTGFGLLILGGTALVLGAQQAGTQTSTTPRMGMEPTRGVDTVRTPAGAAGMGQAPGTGRSAAVTPGAMGSSTAPDTSRSSMPAYRRTPPATSGTAGKTYNRPMAAGDCSGDAWRKFSNPVFKDEKGCQAWVKERGKRKAAPAPQPTAAKP